MRRTGTERELDEIRDELRESGYLRAKRGKQAKQQVLKPHTFTSSDGFTILVGRNNKQNDRLTLRDCEKTDLWFHTKDIPGSHVIVVTGGETPPDSTITEAAELAAYHSKARDSSKVPVDYTLVKNVSKPGGAKPGMVIYVKQTTVFVTPERREESGVRD